MAFCHSLIVGNVITLILVHLFQWSCGKYATYVIIGLRFVRINLIQIKNSTLLLCVLVITYYEYMLKLKLKKKTCKVVSGA